MKFAHLGDCHLGGWRQPELKELNFRSFQSAIKTSIKEKVDFILIAGDLFDSPYPPIDILKRTFAEFRNIKDAKIPAFIIAGSHDYSISGKTFLEVLEKSGFCKNVSNYEEKNGRILLEPTLHENVAIYGYPGKKSGLEINDIEKIKLQDSPGLFKILMLHTTIKGAVGNPFIKSVDEEALPKVDYLALAHLHINYRKGSVVYCGPTFPNNISELEELKHGSFYIYSNGQIKRHEIKLNDVASFVIEIQNTLPSTDELIALFAREKVSNKIVILRLAGLLEAGKISNIDFQKIELFLKKQGATVFLKSTSRLHIAEPEFRITLGEHENIESEIISRFKVAHPSTFNNLASDLISALAVEKNEDESKMTFEERLLSETKKVCQYDF